MTHAINGIDHAIIGVADLEAARETVSAPRLCRHRPRDAMLAGGTANYCVMFDDDYLELLGLIDSTAFTNGLDRFLEKGEGGLGCGLFHPGCRGIACTAWGGRGWLRPRMRCAIWAG